MAKTDLVKIPRLSNKLGIAMQFVANRSLRHMPQYLSD